MTFSFLTRPLALPLLLLAPLLHADHFSFQWYNDIFAGTDRHFTNGGSISWLDDTFGSKGENESNRYSALIFNLADSLPLTTMDVSRKHNAGISISQMMITPAELNQTTPQYNDVPYAGYLDCSFYLFEWDQNSFDEYRVDFGIVGKASGAEWVQKTIHRIIGNDEPQGWGTQLGNHLTLNALFRHGEKSWQHRFGGGIDMDWFNHAGFQVGNFVTDGFGGTILRLGQNYINNFNVNYPYFKEEAALLELQQHHRGFGWSVSAGIDGRLLLYSYIFEEAKDKGYALTPYRLNATLYAGTSFYYEGQKLTFFYQTQSPYVHEERQIDSFGGFKFVFRF